MKNTRQAYILPFYTPTVPGPGQRVIYFLKVMLPAWPIADNICFECKVNGRWPRPLLTYYEVNTILRLLLLIRWPFGLGKKSDFEIMQLFIKI